MFKLKTIGKKTKIGIGLLSVLFIFWLFSLPEPLFNSPNSTVVLDKDNQLVGARLAADGQWRFPNSDSIPYKLKQCIVTFEDKWFYNHPGVNPVSIFRAAVQNIKTGHIVSGGSTISMQVIRLSRENKERTFFEKFIEISLALRLELRYSKEEILNLYFSNAPFGGNTVGVQTASWRYFGREGKDLSWAEASTLAVLPNAPSLIHPGKNRERLLKKRNRLLNKLQAEGIIDTETCTLAISEPLPGKPQSLQKMAPHLIDRIDKNDNRTVIKSTIDRNIQQKVETTVNHYHSVYIQNQIQNMAVIVAKTSTGEVLAYCGNSGYDKMDNNHVDIITSQRSTGSTLKPFLYNAMLEDGKILPEMLLPDVPILIAGYKPNNFDRKFDGAVPANEALARSLNIPAVLMLREYGTPKFMDYLKKAGMTTLNYSADHYGLTLILGGAEGTLWDLTGMYANMGRTLNRFNNNFNYCEDDIHPLYYNKAEQPKMKGKIQYSPFLFNGPTVWETMDAIKELNRPGISDWRVFSSSRRVGWKTGTSFGNKDAWSIGVTPEYVVGVWVGNADGEGRPGLTGVTHAAPVMFSIFNQLPATSWFKKPSKGMVSIEICPQSGYRRGPNCPEGKFKNASKTEEKCASCPYHRIVHLSPDKKNRVTSRCMSVNKMIHEKWFVLPPSMEWYYKMHNSSYKSLPPYQDGCIAANEALPMEFVYPKEDSKLFIPIDIDGKKSEIIFEVAHHDKDATLYWHLDEQYIGSTYQFHKKGIDAEVGKHILTITDNQGNTINKKFEIVN
ncbi:MAG TPA: penicillin-binding protein 1C [Paludibacteraceae bacterium]|nr:penicillin-binding protein 1C [Paludibacteraceae bacterium]HQF50253.1 penicillin-binding protein 1C [Paludibacteraceae bacterium]HQJ90154.1 penicillin-binding protein 1C [Paludibacteraceae bacterium]